VPNTDHFQRVYQTLNPEQRQAVDTLDGPVMVIAGPGTGKTQVLAARIANILLKTDTNPSSILALTFTESAAKNMRQRLVSMIGKTGYYVQIHTFHSFCTDVIQSHPEFFSIDRDSHPLSELERYDLLQSIIDQLPLQALKPLNTPYFYLRDIVKTISDLKREGLSVADFATIVASDQTLFAAQQETLKKTEKARWEKQLAKNVELVQIYERYQQGLRDSLRYDFDDMIALVVGAFKAEELLLTEYQERLLYFLVDEYQDTNSAQNQVVDLLASYWEESANIFVVGDPNQAIYRFQGASLENVIGFTKRYPAAQVITLTVGYRSPQQIYDAAATLITNNQTTTAAKTFNLSIALQSVHHSKDTTINIYRSPSQTLESVYLACAIEKLIKSGVNPSEIAILYRNNSDAADIMTALDKWQVRYEIDGGNNVLEVEPICQLLDLFRVIQTVIAGNEDGLTYKVMSYEWLGLSPLLVMQAARAASKAKCSLVEIIQQGFEVFTKYQFDQEVTPLEFEALKNFVTQVSQWASKDAQLTLPAWFEVVITESGFLKWLNQRPDKIELLNALNSLFREIKALSSARREFKLADFLAVLETLEAHSLPITMEDLNVTENAVRLSTVHKAKGQEWEHVFIARCVDGKWGNAIKRELLPLPSGILHNTDLSQKERNEDDRRLFYVAITRAKKTLTICYPETIIMENRSKAVVGSVFIEEIKDHLTELDDELCASVVNKADEHLVQLLSPAPSRATSVSEKTFFEHLVKDWRLSVSSLNTYLHSPQSFIESCLLKVPTTKAPALAFGTAAHFALEQLMKEYQQDGQWLSVAKFLEYFEMSLAKEDLTTSQFEARRAYGRQVLTRYYQELMIEPPRPAFVERFFGVGWSRTVLDDIVLTGRVDRIDWIDMKAQTTRVVDYKTGTPRTMGEIEGKTISAELSAREQSLPESIRGPYKRQLLFYKLLTQLDKTFQPTVTSGVFEFLEPDKQSGKLVQRHFELPDDEVEDLKHIIKEVMAEIRGLAFLK